MREMNEAEFNAWKIFVAEYRKFKKRFDKKFPTQAKLINKYYNEVGNTDAEDNQDDADWWKDE